jgi:hypothetical protein
MITVDNQVDYLQVAVFEVDRLDHQPSTPEFDAWVDQQCQLAITEKSTPQWEARREAVRALLRKGGYKPSGRSKPAQEYLAKCLDESKFPTGMPLRSGLQSGLENPTNGIFLTPSAKSLNSKI